VHYEHIGDGYADIRYLARLRRFDSGRLTQYEYNETGVRHDLPERASIEGGWR
jgi:hypothetical protein